jgi:hypothetical protein
MHSIDSTMVMAFPVSPRGGGILCDAQPYGLNLVPACLKFFHVRLRRAGRVIYPTLEPHEAKIIGKDLARLPMLRKQPWAAPFDDDPGDVGSR